MMEHYVTLFDSKFLPQGLSLYRSMERWCGEFTLWVICMDEIVEEILTDLRCSRIKLIPLATIETPELQEVKGDRSIAEYCWTITPFSPDAVFKLDHSVERVTYVDADLWFRSSPLRIFEEFEKSDASVMITEHGFAPETDQSAESGVYCVQFMIFARLKSSSVRRKWQQQCTDWCYNRVEDGKFGDQKYLDTWLIDFGDLIHVMEHLEWALAPWNATRFPYSEGVFFHFHSLRLVSKDRAAIGFYQLPQTLINHVYRPYLEDVKHSLANLQGYTQETHPSWVQQAKRPGSRYVFRYWKRKLRIFSSSTQLRI